MGEMWVTHEIPPRILSVAGRALVDPDCLVAYVEGGDGKPLWIIDGGRSADCAVIGLEKPGPYQFVCASRAATGEEKADG